MFNDRASAHVPHLRKHSASRGGCLVIASRHVIGFGRSIEAVPHEKRGGSVGERTGLAFASVTVVAQSYLAADSHCFPDFRRVELVQENFG